MIESDSWRAFLKEVGINFNFEQVFEIPDLQVCKFDGIRFSDEFLNAAYKRAKGVNPMMVQLQAVDFLFKKNNNFWPKLVLKEGLHLAILYKHPQLSARDSGLIVGSGITARLVASVLIDLGFSHITFVSNKVVEEKNFINDLKSNYFQINFELIEREKVILLPGIYSVIINTWDILKEPELLTDLLYFNYLKQPGLVINVIKTLGEDSLIEEAQAISEKTIQHKEVEFFVELNTIRPFVELNEKKIRDFVQSVVS